MRSLALAVTLTTLGLTAAAATEPVDWEMVTRIRDEGLNRSQVMATAEHLTERIGPRLTGSPQMTAAAEWTRAKLAEWGLQNSHLETWGPFGRGWSFSRVAVHLVEPYPLPIPALPKAWTRGTDGPVRGRLLKVTLESEEDLTKLAGTLRGTILLLDDVRPLRDATAPVVERYDDDELAKLVPFELPGERRGAWRRDAAKRARLRTKVRQFLLDEGVVATFELSSRDGNLVRLGGDSGAWAADVTPGVPGLVLSAEHYGRLVRLVGGAEKDKKDGEQRAEAVVEVEVGATFHEGDGMEANVVAEIPGTGDEVVLLGAHLDSWHGGTGATDNAAGCAMVMEAARILQALGVKPRRTIRVVLWSGEEQGLMGSRAYVEKHFAAWTPAEDPAEADLPPWMRSSKAPLVVHPEHARVAAYFNLDNGAGRIRGIYTQGNSGVVPIFSAWLQPVADLGATTVTVNDTGGTDHQSFDRVGLPGFQFIQDELDYDSRTHHTAADTFEHLVREDLMQGATVLATFVYHTAIRESLLPREPLPTSPP